MIIRTSLLIIASAFLSSTAHSEESLSDYEKFVSYPYLGKAYRYQAANNFENAIKEIKKAIDVAPEHAPYQVLLFEYYVANNQQQDALFLYASLPEDAKGTLLASLIEIQIKDEQLVLSENLKTMLNLAPNEQREELYITVASRLIGKGKETQVYEWLKGLDVTSIELITTKIRLADKLGIHADVEQYFLELSVDQRSAEIARIYAFSLLKSGKSNRALEYANQNPSDTLSFDIYYQYLQTSIANNNTEATNRAFAWIETHHQFTPELLEQKLEFAIQSKDRETAFAILPQLNTNCQKRIELALSFDWLDKAVDELVICHNNMEQSLWISYASSLLTTSMMEKLVLKKVRYASLLSEVLIGRYIAKAKYNLAINEILRTKKEAIYIETLAISYEKLGEIDKALTFWETIYSRSNTDVNLDKITFLQLKQNQKAKATALLEKRLIDNPSSMSPELVSRLVSIYQLQSHELNPAIVKSLMRVTNNYDAIAELFRINNNCEAAIRVLDNTNQVSSQSFQTRALCTDGGDQKLELVYWQKAYDINPTEESIRAISYAQGSLGETDTALNSLNQIDKTNWSKQDYLYAAQLAYQQRNYQDSENYWTLAKGNNPAWFDFGIELAIQQHQYQKAQQLSQQLLNINSDLTAQQWARQATIYQRTGENLKASRAWQIANEKDPENTSFKLAWAYSLIDTQNDRAFIIMKDAIGNASDVDTRTWEQLGYLAAANHDQSAALEYITKSIESERQGLLPRGEELSWMLHEYYRDLSQYWRFNVSASVGTGGILGEVFFTSNDGELLAEPPTNNVTARSEYFFNPLKKKWSIYGQVSGNGADDNPLNDWSKELGFSYKPFSDLNVKGTLGTQRFFSGDWEGLVRVNGDLLNQGKWRQGWRFDQNWWERQFYFDLLWLPESEQFLGLARFDIGYVHSLNTESKQTLKYYGLAQYDQRKPQNPVKEKSSFDQSSLGLGIQWRLFTTPNSPFDRVHKYSLALEWRIKASGNLASDDSSLFFIATYQY